MNSWFDGESYETREVVLLQPVQNQITNSAQASDFVAFCLLAFAFLLISSISIPFFSATSPHSFIPCSRATAFLWCRRRGRATSNLSSLVGSKHYRRRRIWNTHRQPTVVSSVVMFGVSRLSTCHIHALIKVMHLHNSFCGYELSSRLTGPKLYASSRLPTGDAIQRTRVNWARLDRAWLDPPPPANSMDLISLFECPACMDFAPPPTL